MRKLSYKWIVLFLASGALCFSVLNYCERREPQSQPLAITKSDTLYLKDTSRHQSVTNQFYTSKIFTVLPAGHIDTNAVVKAFYTKKIVQDVLQDSIIRLLITDSLYGNEIVYRHRSYQLLKPYETRITTTTTLIPAPVFPKGIYVGPFFGFNNALQGAGLEANYVTHKFSYGLAYDFKNNAVQGKFLIRIKK
jgi:hypothetical protein